MTDITKCPGDGCPLRDKCWRYLAPDEGLQSYSDYFNRLKTDDDGKVACDGYWER